MKLKVETNTFQFYTFPSKDGNNSLKISLLAQQQFNLSKQTSGISELKSEDNVLIMAYKEIIEKGISDAFDEETGERTVYNYQALETATFLFLEGFVVAYGQPTAIKNGVWAIMKASNISPVLISLAPQTLYKTSEAMDFIKTIQLDKMKNKSVKKFRADGNIECLSDIAPLGEDCEANFKAVKGIIKTSFGPKTVNFRSDGKIQIKRNKKEDLDTDFLTELYNKWLK